MGHKVFPTMYSVLGLTSLPHGQIVSSLSFCVLFNFELVTVMRVVKLNVVTEDLLLKVAWGMT
jgi:hypothetical protein